LIYARSRRPTLALAVALLAAALGFGAGAGWLLWTRPADGAPILLAIAGAFCLAFAGREGLRLRRWPPASLSLFRDRLVLIQGRSELGAAWDQIQLVSLADQTEWGSLRWPEVRLTERLTLRLDPKRAISFRPRLLGLEPVACRDLILRLRDDEKEREGLPEFDSELDLALHR
jgi:hypothetical protein